MAIKEFAARRPLSYEAALRMRPFKLRTILLMVVALFAFFRLWCVTHPASTSSGQGANATRVEVVPVAAPPDAGSPAAPAADAGA